MVPGAVGMVIATNPSFLTFAGIEVQFSKNVAVYADYKIVQYR